MKPPILSALFLGALALAIGLMNTSCVNLPDEVTVNEQYRPGYVTQTLPTQYRTEVLGGTTYYTSNGTYFRSQGGSYVVVDPPTSVRRTTITTTSP